MNTRINLFARSTLAVGLGMAIAASAGPALACPCDSLLR